ncbi:2449_t:CDS:1, partial [Racocetra fulgida]
DQEGSNIDSEEEISDDQTDASEAVSAEVIESTSPPPVSYDFNSSSET